MPTDILGACLWRQLEYHCKPPRRRVYSACAGADGDWPMSVIGQDALCAIASRRGLGKLFFSATPTGRLRTEASRDVKQILGRIRLVNEGRLRELWEELVRDAARLLEDCTERAVCVVTGPDGIWIIR